MKYHLSKYSKVTFSERELRAPKLWAENIYKRAVSINKGGFSIPI